MKDSGKRLKKKGRQRERERGGEQWRKRKRY